MIHSHQIRTAGGLGFRRRVGQIPSIDPVSAAVGLASAAVGQWMNSIQLSHDADTATTLIVNGLATQLQNLDDAYLAEPDPSCADQRSALDAYDQAWAWLQSPAACGNPSYGSAGNRCISDRAPGGEYPWATYYRDPIANDPRLATAGCDTGSELLLPSLATGTYAATALTSTPADGTTPAAAPVPAAPATPAAVASAAVASAAIAPAAGSTTLSSFLATLTANPALALGGGAILFLLLARGGSE